MNKSSSWTSRLRKGLFALALCAAVSAAGPMVNASDHDDGETGTKGRNRNLTDLFAFREDWQTGNAANAGDVVLIMNTNPRSVARQHYFFDTQARYNFFYSQVGVNTSTPTGFPSGALRFQFAAPTAAGTQAITLTHDDFQAGTNTIIGRVSVAAGTTTPAPRGIGNPNPAPVLNAVTVEGRNLTVFAGLREDPFFFDVEQYFRVRAALLGLGPLPAGAGVQPTGFRTAATAIDFAKGYNVNAIAVRVPIAFLNEGNAGVTTFDIWETIDVGP
ncbi:MAG: DUF4331 family protein [Candidatus Eremiobacterota bacterium]